MTHLHRLPCVCVGARASVAPAGRAAFYTWTAYAIGVNRTAAELGMAPHVHKANTTKATTTLRIPKQDVIAATYVLPASHTPQHSSSPRPPYQRVIACSVPEPLER